MKLPSARALLRFMKSLPATSDFDQWCERFKEELPQLLGDVDRVSVGINYTGDLNAFDGRMNPATRIDVSEYDDREGTRSDVVMRTFDRDWSFSQQLVNDLRALGYPIDRHQPPLCYDFHYDNGRFIGCIVLWRDVGNPPISKQTCELMEELRPFFRYVLSDFVARYHQDHPTAPMLLNAVFRTLGDAGLSLQEQKILWLRILGHSYKTIARQLEISITTVKKHLNTIHRKTGTGSITEIFGKYVAGFFESGA